ncbi:hypothetical protein GQ53DRAFT_76593 [Thozetella sp. PMI_491]|nr:hypothetical protein GQ53DRAFT_76593 [Thozetella sp. PMI_491]
MEDIPQDRDGGDSPQIVRPIPRRPFNLNLVNATPPEEESTPTTPSINANDLRFLDPRYQGQSQLPLDDNSHSLSRAASYMNLTSSTLFGIFSSSSLGRDRFDDRDEPATPWGTGSMTPAYRPGMDDATYELMRERSRSQSARRPSFVSDRGKQEPEQATPASAASLSFRALLLFALGTGYGVLVSQLPSQQNLAALGVDTALDAGFDWQYLAIWGVAGVLLGGLLPWFDRVWEDTFGRGERALAKGASEEKQGSPETDWALVVRGIGAFVGIVFAIRRLPWASTLQVSVALALANPFLWYLIDRSKPGFLLSAAVSVAGSALLLSLKPDVMPAPSYWSPSDPLDLNGTSSRRPESLGGFASQETVETTVWMVSVLFCSCLCFGNIGRRLALNRSAAARGRWGGVR